MDGKTARLPLLALCLTASLFGAPARAWGPVGHEVVATNGAQLAPGSKKFWKSYVEPIRALTNVPDNTWKAGPHEAEERINHRLQIDAYFANPADFDRIPHAYSEMLADYGESTVLLYGTAPWRIQQFYDQAVAALRAGDYVRGIQYAGTLSHYVGDIAQPMHVALNYSGDLSGQSGLHGWFESSVVNRYDRASLDAAVLAKATKLLKDKAFLANFNGSLVDAVFAEVDRSHAWLATVLQIDKTYGRNATAVAKYRTLIEDRLADGAATYALVLKRLWLDSGKPSPASTGPIPIPAWPSSQF